MKALAETVPISASKSDARSGTGPLTEAAGAFATPVAATLSPISKSVKRCYCPMSLGSRRSSWLPSPPEQRRRTYRLCPAFVVEVRSPGDSLLAQQERMENWIHLGVRLGWLVDERGESVWIYRPGSEPERQIRPKQLSGEDVLEGLTVDCTRIWAMADDLASL